MAGDDAGNGAARELALVLRAIPPGGEPKIAFAVDEVEEVDIVGVVELAGCDTRFAQLPERAPGCRDGSDEEELRVLAHAGQRADS